jgi:hypothetical protein
MGKLSSAFEKVDTSAAYPFGVINLIPALGIQFRIANSCRRYRCNFKVLKEWGLADFSKNLRA